MRIALFSGNYNYLREGANQALNVLVRYLEASAGCEVRVYSPVTDTPAFEPAGTLVPVPSVALPVRGEFRLALRLPAQIRDDIARFRPQIVHVSTPDILGTRAQTFARQLGVPIVASMHTLFETYLDYYRIGWARPLVEAHLRRFYRRADHVLAPTPDLVETLRRMRGDGAASVWSRGIDRNLFNPARRDTVWRAAQGIAPDEVIVLFFGRVVLEKGVEIFVSVVRALQQRGLPVRALVIGAGPAEDRFKDLPGTIRTGHLEGPALARAVASADLLLSPSTTETFGNIMLEAMASGLPVVSADTASARGMLSGSTAGILCSPLDVQAYADAIAGLFGSVERRNAMGAAAMDASMAYSWDEASQSVERIYRSLVSGEQARP
ncbi:MAG: glycosyltransferase family 1 protein [Novosphingobium sp.]